MREMWYKLPSVSQLKPSKPQQRVTRGLVAFSLLIVALLSFLSIYGASGQAVTTVTMLGVFTTQSTESYVNQYTVSMSSQSTTQTGFTVELTLTPNPFDVPITDAKMTWKLFAKRLTITSSHTLGGGTSRLRSDVLIGVFGGGLVVRTPQSKKKTHNPALIYHHGNLVINSVAKEPIIAPITAAQTLIDTKLEVCISLLT